MGAEVPAAAALAAELERLGRRGGVKWHRYGPEVLAAWVADMDLDPPAVVVEALRGVLDRGDLGYPEIRGSGLAELAAERHAARFGWHPDPELVVPLADVMQGVVLAITALTEPGDGVVVQTPIYPPFHRAVAATGRRLDDHPLRIAPDGRASLDVEALAALVDDRTRLLLVCNPHNPTGRVLSADELGALGRLAVERDLVIVADEIHADLVHPGSRHLTMPALGPEIAERTLVLTSPTKAFNLAGTRIAVALPGSPALARRLAAVPRHLLGAPGTFGLVAADAAWRRGDPWLRATLALLTEHRDVVTAWARRRPGIVHAPPEATYLAWLDLRALDLPGGPFRYLLDRAGVALSDGAEFTAHGAGHVRLNFATTRPVLDAVLERIDAALDAV